jgi:superfamily I DNA/RNA helicase
VAKPSLKIEKALNETQIEAVSNIEGPLLVLAGAGTGKTRVITYRIANMIDHGIAAERILGLTFTNKAAREMRERLAAIVHREKASKVILGTFHSFCARFLRRHATVRGYTNDFTIADDTDQSGILRQAVSDLQIRKDLINLPQCQYYVSKVKSEMGSPLDLVFRDTVMSEAFPRIFKRYNQTLQNQNMFDFDDLLLVTVEILRDNPDILEKQRSGRTHILVDEYQDTNFLQFRLLELLAGEGRNICVVGDDDQSIYGWRGAKIENILNFADKFRGAATIKLEQNYRSTNTILEASNAIISKNLDRHEKKLWSDLGDGAPIKIVKTKNAEEEARFVSDTVMDAIADGERLRYDDIVVLYRSNHLSRLIEEALRIARIPYRLVGAKSFYDRKEIRDAAAYLKIIVNKRDDQSLLRILGVPPRGIGDKAVEKLKKIREETRSPLCEILSVPSFQGSISSAGAAGARRLAETLRAFRIEFQRSAEHGGLAGTAKAYLEQVGYLDGLAKIHKNEDEYQKRRDNVLELVNAISEYDAKKGNAASLLDFLEAHSLADDNDKVKDDSEGKNAVTLMTVHAAKGLEFPMVIVIGMEEGTFPNEKAKLADSLEEERRLFYVAMTRAKQRLVLTRAQERMKHGIYSRRNPSQFLDDIPEANTSFSDARNAFKKVDADSLLKAFENFTI